MKPTHIKLYSTTTCPYCMMEKAWLEEEKIDHEVVYVDQNREEAQKMVDKTQQMGVPVTEISFENGKEEYVVGFNKPLLQHLLKN
jgi:glutaredoxin 3